MNARESFASDLNLLHDKLIEQGELCQESLALALDALVKKDVEIALTIIENDDAIDTLEEEVNDTAIWLIAKQQPVSTDLRRIIVAIKIAAELERIGDYSVNIAKAVIRIGDADIAYDTNIVKEMIEQTSLMLTKALKAYHEEDVKLAKEAIDIDDVVDDLYAKLVRELLLLQVEAKSQMSAAQQMSFVARYIERSADHVTNILENIVYLVKGKKFEHNN
ncbi:MAG: phosphate signaling complex protein PhoU [Bacilli bacterium]